MVVRQDRTLRSTHRCVMGAVWTPAVGMVPTDLPTGDTEESSTEGEESSCDEERKEPESSRVESASSRLDRGTAMAESSGGAAASSEALVKEEAAESQRVPAPVDQEEEMVAIHPPPVADSRVGVALSRSDRGRLLDQVAQERALTPFEEGLRDPSPPIEVPRSRWLSEDGAYCTLCRRYMVSNQHGGHAVSPQHLQNMKALRRQLRAEKASASGTHEVGPRGEPPIRAPAPVPVPEPGPVCQEEEAEGEGASSSASRVGVAPSRPDRGPDRARGEMGSEELEAVWGSKPRTVGQRMLESALTAASSHELRYQEAHQQGLERLVNKQVERPTSGGKDQLDRTLRAITTSTTTSAVLRKRAGQEVKSTGEHEFGQFITEGLTGGAGERLDIATSVKPASLSRDTRYAAAIRDPEQEDGSRTLKRQARSRQRAAVRRQDVSRDLAGQRRETGDADRTDVRTTGWNPDDGLEELQYPSGSWHCGWCATVCGPTDDACVGWVKGERCKGSYYRSFSRWANARPEGRKQGRQRMTALEAALRKSKWECSLCGKSNLGFRARCYKCSALRPEPDLASTDEDDDVDAEKETKKLSRAEQGNLKREAGLSGKKKKRAGVKHAKKKKRCRCGRSHKGHHRAEGRSPLAGRACAFAALTAAVLRWRRLHVPSKARNKRMHALHGNTSVAFVAKLLMVGALIPIAFRTEQEAEMLVSEVSMMAAKTIGEIEEIAVSTVRTVNYVWLAVLYSFSIIGLWWVGRVVMNKIAHLKHGNTATPEPKLLELKEGTSVWEVAGRRPHRVQVKGRGASCDCRQYIDTGKCRHCDIALSAARRHLPGSSSIGAGERPRSRPGALERGRAVVGEAKESSRQAVATVLSGCFNGLVEKARAVHLARGAPSHRASSRLSSQDRSKSLRESLSLDSGPRDLAVGAAPSRPDAGPERLALMDRPEAADSHPTPDFAPDTLRSSTTGLTTELLVNQANQDRAIRFLEVKGEAMMLAYTFDQPDIVDALLRRSGTTRLLVDKGQSTGERTKLQRQSLLQLSRGGVRIRLISGSSLSEAYQRDNRSNVIGRGLRGIQHSKSLLVSEAEGSTGRLVLGSSNFTTSSRANAELGVSLVGDVHHQVFQDYVAHFELLWSTAQIFDGSEQETRRRITGKQRPVEEE